MDGHGEEAYIIYAFEQCLSIVGLAQLLLLLLLGQTGIDPCLALVYLTCEERKRGQWM